MKSDTPDYDPRFDRAQSVEGAKARYVQNKDYTLIDLESDIERILTEGKNPDSYCDGLHLGTCPGCPPKDDRSILGGQTVR